MARKEVVLKMLGRYEDQLVQGILPRGVVSVLRQYVEAQERAERSYGRAASSAERLFSASTLNTMRTFSVIGSSAGRETLRSINRAESVQRQPEYEIGVFAREHLLLKPDGVSLAPEDVEENRRRIQDYRKQLESQMV
ncbi:MAG: hypothetical protein HY512_00325 [Candidatus Aenigmarchaeota archaeon]|nr:hypothetical protein [Candidatus Aenigmarchaeota archaeon]